MKGYTQSSSLLPFLRLALIFFVSCAIPIVIALQLRPPPENTSNGEVEEDPRFPHALVVNAQGSLVTVPNSPEISPIEGKDFAIVVWFKPKKYVEDEDRVMIVAKLDTDDPSRRGYAVGYTREGGVFYPLVYWRDRKLKGGYFRFESVPILPQSWSVFLVSFQEGKFLGLHAGTELPNGNVELALKGGYELEPPIYPTNDSALLIGAPKAGKFRGAIGAVGVFSKEQLGANLPELLRSITESVREPPSTIDEDAVKLWMSDELSGKSSGQHSGKKGRKKASQS